VPEDEEEGEGEKHEDREIGQSPVEVPRFDRQSVMRLPTLDAPPVMSVSDGDDLTTTWSASARRHPSDLWTARILESCCNFASPNTWRPAWSGRMQLAVEDRRGAGMPPHFNQQG